MSTNLKKLVMMDHVPNDIAYSKARYIVVITDQILLESANKAIDNYIARGLYPFTAKEKANEFANQINRQMQEPIAFVFSKTERK